MLEIPSSPIFDVQGEQTRRKVSFPETDTHQATRVAAGIPSGRRGESRPTPHADRGPLGITMKQWFTAWQ